MEWKTLTNLMSEPAAQAREGKRKYERKSSDSKRKKNARTYVERQNLPQPSSSRKHVQETEVSENASADAFVTSLASVTKKRRMRMTPLAFMKSQY